MLRFVSRARFAGEAISRREWLRIGGLAGLGMLARPAQGATGHPPGFGKAKSVIVVYANGGQSQLEMWDPKPDAPEQIRGEFGAIRTSVPGTFVGEHMPLIAARAHRYTIVRSVSHDDLDHGSATYLALTGRFHPKKSSNPPPSPNDFPALGAVLTKVRPAQRFPYTSVHVNAPALVPELPGPGQDGGFLGREFEPLVIGDVSRAAALLPGLNPPPELPPVRIESRRTWLDSVEGYCRLLERDPSALAMNTMYRQAYEMLASPRSRAAFDLDAEPALVRDRYGRHRSGQACLLARRLAEAGVPLVTVVWNHSARGQDKTPEDTDSYGWDTHNDIFEALRVHLLPRFDQSFSALVDDLADRGLLETTLLVCMGEFGRAPRVALEPKFAGASPGRKHWANVYSIVMAGAGVTPGALFGASDRIAGHPESDRVSPCDIAATIYNALGIDYAETYYDAVGRPFPISTGQPIAGLYRG